VKNVLIIASLAVIFVSVFMTKAGKLPSSEGQFDDLGIGTVYLDPASDQLHLTTSQGWAEVSLNRVTETNLRFKYSPKPEDGNSVSIVQKGPSEDELESMKCVPIVPGKQGSFEYYHYPPDGKARVAESEVAAIPSGYEMALYRGPAETLADRKTFVQSYILVTKEKQADGRCGYQFFFNPYKGAGISWEWPNENILYLPAFLSICIALPLAFSDVRGAACWGLIGAALVLNAISWLLSFVLAGFGHAFGNYDRAEAPFPVMLSAVILAVLVAVKLSRPAVAAKK
jgi:hypothetical protein